MDKYRGIVSVKRAALRYARNSARNNGFLLRPFRQIAGYDNQLGCEWVAITRCGKHFVSVFVPRGERETIQAVADAQFTKTIAGRVVAFGGSALRKP